ncbi:MAG: hypothetical protein JW723_04125 [Bacteroidales bacterium]|nr:hypothetical protein [Bacteroidales bacterium]
MKKIILSLASLFTFLLFAFSQSPQAFKYQAVARDGSGNILANQSVSVKISILQGTPTGSIAYSETHNVSTDAYGLINLNIGEGTPVSGAFSGISWGNDKFYLKLEMDPAGGTSYEAFEPSQLLSVPYALHATTVETEGQTLSVEGQNISISDGNTIEAPSLWSQNENKLYYNKGNVGIGTDDPSATLQVNGTLMVGSGSKLVSAIVEIKDTTDATNNYKSILMPLGYTIGNTRVLDVSIYKTSLFSSSYCGLGYTATNGTIGYTMNHTNIIMKSTDDTQAPIEPIPIKFADGLTVYYPDELKDKPFRVLLMKVSDAE